MNAREMERLFEEWRQLTAAEGLAISSDDWASVQHHQEHKKLLQERLTSAKKAWRCLWPGTNETDADFERQFQPILSELISMETANSHLIAERRERAQLESNECDRAAGNLRDLNRAYGTSSGGHWISYS